MLNNFICLTCPLLLPCQLDNIWEKSSYSAGFLTAAYSSGRHWPASHCLSLDLCRDVGLLLLFSSKFKSSCHSTTTGHHASLQAQTQHEKTWIDVCKPNGLLLHVRKSEPQWLSCSCTASSSNSTEVLFVLQARRWLLLDGRLLQRAIQTQQEASAMPSLWVRGGEQEWRGTERTHGITGDWIDLIIQRIHCNCVCVKENEMKTHRWWIAIINKAGEL